MIKVAVLVGSLRKDSYNLKVAKHLQERYADRLELEILDIDLPLYNEELNTPETRPNNVQVFMDKIEEADALFMVSPEYNHGISGVMKNAIDWASRPDKGKRGLIAKIVLPMTASTGATAGARAYSSILITLNCLAVKVLPGNDIMFGAVHTQFDENDKLINEGTIKFVDGVIEKWIKFYHKMSQ